LNSIIFRYAFVDESGTVGAENGTNFFIVALASVGQARVLELPVRRALKKFGRRLSIGEMKASRLTESVAMRMLEEIARQDIQISAVIVDQTTIIHPPEDSEIIYRQAITRVIYKLIEKYPMVEISIDRRYTNENLRYELEKHIRTGIQDLNHRMVLIRQENSFASKELQAVDAITWAFFQKFERSDSRFYDVIASKVVSEEIIRERNWKDR
jgi:hypothetical protein